MQVIIQPSYGNKVAQRHWEDTLGQEVNFHDQLHLGSLSNEQQEALDDLHPTGRARFWGATGNQDKKMATVKTGDIILFTGLKFVRAVGEVGYSFRNPAFADTLWHPDPKMGSYSNVYSLLAFDPTEIPYKEIWDLPGFNAGDNFIGLRLLDREKTATVMAGLRIHTRTASWEAEKNEEAVAKAIRSSGRFVAVEAINTPRTWSKSTEGYTLVQRAEALMVGVYRETLGSQEVGRIRVENGGVTDLYVRHEHGIEIIEAKSGSSHGYVRQALGQLLDYAYFSRLEEVTLLTALFPSRPSDADVGLLHQFGIDCLFMTRKTFERLPAPVENGARVRQIWRAV